MHENTKINYLELPAKDLSAAKLFFTDVFKEPLINYAIPLAYRPVHNQGGALKECLGLVKSDNAE